MRCKLEEVEGAISELGTYLIGLLFANYLNDVTYSFHICLQFFYNIFRSQLGSLPSAVPLITPQLIV